MVKARVLAPLGPSRTVGGGQRGRCVSNLSYQNRDTTNRLRGDQSWGPNDVWGRQRVSDGLQAVSGKPLARGPAGHAFPREATEGRGRHAEDRPLLHRLGAELEVEIPGGGVPVEDRPLHAPAAPLDGDLGEARQQAASDAAPALLRHDEQVLEVEGRPPGEGREREEVEGEP